MLYYFLYPFRQHFGPFRVFGYLSFRAAGAARGRRIRTRRKA